jgi:threonine/homoserine/homoserine lactone efflux protein
MTYDLAVTLAVSRGLAYTAIAVIAVIAGVALGLLFHLLTLPGDDR